MSAKQPSDEMLRELRMRCSQQEEYPGFQGIHASHRTKEQNNNSIKSRSTSASADSHLTRSNGSDEAENNLHQSNEENSRQSSLQRRRLELTSKRFTIRESYLTALFSVEHMQTIYRVLHLIFAVFVLNNTIQEFFHEGRYVYENINENCLCIRTKVFLTEDCHLQ